MTVAGQARRVTATFTAGSVATFSRTATWPRCSVSLVGSDATAAGTRVSARPAAAAPAATPRNRRERSVVVVTDTWKYLEESGAPSGALGRDAVVWTSRPRRATPHE